MSRIDELCQQLSQLRRLLNEEGEPYWDTEFDWMYGRIAKRNTLKFRRRGGRPFPKKGE